MWSAVKWLYGAIERGVAKGWVNVVTKSGKAYKAASASAKGGMVTAATVRATAVTRFAFSSVGTVVGGWLAYLGINWTAKKADDASATLGFLTIVTALTAIGVGATLVLRKK